MALASAQILCGNLQDAVGVDEKFHFDARQAGGRRRNLQRETSERTAISREFAFALQDVDVNAGLIVDAGSIEFLRARGNGGIARDNFCDGAAVGLDAEGERSDIEQEHGFYALVEDVGLDSGAERDDFVGIQFDVRFTVEKLLDGAADERRARGAADEDDFIDVGRFELSVGECLLDGPHGSVNHRANEGFKLGARKLQSEICTVRKRKEQTLVSVLRKPMLERDEPLAELLGELAVWGKIKLVVLENLLVHKGLEQIVDVIAAEVCVAIGG